MKPKYILVLGTVLLGIAGPAAGVWAAGPTTEELTADISEVDQQIAAAKKRAEHFGDGSLIRAQIEMEISTLQQTRAMLDQKLKSWLRGIDLSYSVEGRPLSPASDEVIRQAEDDMAKAEAALRIAEDRASRSTGLVGAMAMAEAQTQRVTIAMERLRIAMLRLGMTFPKQPALGGNPDPTPPPVGKTVDEKGAL